jgi:hypothetical protein
MTLPKLVVSSLIASSSVASSFRSDQPTANCGATNLSNFRNGSVGHYGINFAPGKTYQFDWSREMVVIAEVTTRAKVGQPASAGHVDGWSLLQARERIGSAVNKLSCQDCDPILNCKLLRQPCKFPIALDRFERHLCREGRRVNQAHSPLGLSFGLARRRAETPLSWLCKRPTPLYALPVAQHRMLQASTMLLRTA